MKTHELSKALIALARILKAGPDVEVDDWSFLSSVTSRVGRAPKVKDADLPSALYTLVALNDVSKAQWINFITEYGMDIEIRPRDANRDIVGKILSYLASNSWARERLLKGSGRKNSSQSSELANALNILLK